MAWLRIGHRGAAGSRPELTRPSFERAIELGVDMIELDVQLTRDGGLVVLHDLALGRTVNAAGSVRERSLAELCALDAGSWFAPEYAGVLVPSLEEVLDQTAGRVDLNVEIKSPEPDWRGTADALIELLRCHDCLDSTLISSFSVGALAAVRSVSSDARLGVLTHAADPSPAWASAEQLSAESVNLLWRRANEAVVAETHARGRKLLVWTVNGRRAIARLVKMGVDGIVTDHPEYFEALP